MTAATKGSAGNRQRRRVGGRYVGLLYIAPWIIGLLIFQLYPLLASFAYSFTDFTMVNQPTFIGLRNYIDIFTTDLDFAQSMKVTLLYVVIGIPCKLAVAFIVALILNMQLKGIGFFRTVYYIPSILGGSIAVSIVWRIMFMNDGVVNRALGLLSLPQPEWLSNPIFALFAIDMLIVWQFGSSMLLFLAGLKQIPGEIYEAARVDGASSMRILFTITIPLITPMIFFNLVMQMIIAFQDFTSPFIITNGGPMKGTYLYGMKLYMEAFYYFKMGYASALSWILFAVIMGITIVIFKSASRWVFYQDTGRTNA
jgi:oligogalacturonide transport system permease protein